MKKSLYLPDTKHLVAYNNFHSIALSPATSTSFPGDVFTFMYLFIFPLGQKGKAYIVGFAAYEYFRTSLGKKTKPHIGQNCGLNFDLTENVNLRLDSLVPAGYFQGVIFSLYNNTAVSVEGILVFWPDLTAVVTLGSRSDYFLFTAPDWTPLLEPSLQMWEIQSGISDQHFRIT